ncbi:MAG: glucose 1-dehydrogenase [Anaerolineae bacterium]|jgi:glucose 1-dehydrogenase
MKGLLDKVVLVTGATSGIGQAIAVRFAQEGAHVAVNYHTTGKKVTKTDDLVDEASKQCMQRIAECNVKHVLVQGDVSNDNDVARMFKQTMDELGSLDILINNAGIQIQGPSHEVGIESIDQVLAINLRGAYLCARAAIRHFLNEGKPGVIINDSSVHQIIPRPLYVSYSMSKGGIGNLTRTLALEYADRGIRVNGIGPGATLTPINQRWVNDPEKRAEVESHIPMGRAGTPEEMAGVVAFLASDEAAYITGQTLYIDGGLTLYPDFRTPWSG